MEVLHFLSLSVPKRLQVSFLIKGLESWSFRKLPLSKRICQSWERKTGFWEAVLCCSCSGGSWENRQRLLSLCSHTRVKWQTNHAVVLCRKDWHILKNEIKRIKNSGGYIPWLTLLPKYNLSALCSIRKAVSRPQFFSSYFGLYLTFSSHHFTLIVNALHC